MHVLEQHSEEKGTEKARMLKKFVFLEQLRLIRWGERLFRNCLGTWIGIEEMDKDLQNPQGKI